MVSYSPEQSGDFLSRVSGLSNSASNLIRAIRGQSETGESTARRTLAAGNAAPAWLVPALIVGGAVVVLLVVVNLLRK